MTRHAQRPSSALSSGLICRRLERVYGPVEPPEQGPILDELIATILSQNTSDANSAAAFEELRRRFPDWNAVRQSPAAKLARVIRTAGLSNTKAPRIKTILQTVYEQRGELSLEFLRELPTRVVSAYLQSFPGVGPKTVACVLLFACGRPVLPVDTHVQRVCQRLGLLAPQATAEQAHRELAQRVPRSRVLDFHIQLIRHGRTVCSAANPRCLECMLLDRCPEGYRRLQARRLPEHI
jgi:endonuclease-3